MRKFLLGLLASLVVLSALGGCKTKREIKREQEYERIKQEVREARGARADLDVMSEEFRTELTRISTGLEEQTQLQRVQNEDLRKEVQTLSTRVGVLEQQLAAATAAPPPKIQKAASIESATELFDAEKYEEAIEEAKEVMRTKPKNSPEVRKAHQLLAEAYFASRDYGAAALEFSEFKKAYPKDPNAATATLRQAQSFRGLGKEKEAKLFFQEVVDRYPKSSAATTAKKELKKGK
ncbi:tetratricopeptide repeat protein [bacterium]|nr:tetratricopeptide repeat protein [bacterium]